MNFPWTDRAPSKRATTGHPLRHFGYLLLPFSGSIHPSSPTGYYLHPIPSQPMAFSSALRSSPLAAAAAHAASPRQRLSVGSRCLARVVSGSSRSSRAAARALSVRCEQSSKGGSAVDVWAGRLAMMSFATAVVSEVSTGKGLVEVSFGSIPRRSLHD